MDRDPYMLRLCYAVGFYFVYRLLDIVVLLITIIQFGHQLLIGEPHAELKRFGEALGTYIAQIIQYLAWSGNKKPYPFSDWPSLDEKIDR